jgi:peroxiredoxin
MPMLGIRWVTWLACCLPLWAYAAGVEEGQTAPGIALPGLTGDERTYRLEDLRGTVVYVDFWASWCVPCRVSFPVLDALRAELGPRGFEVLAVSVDASRTDALGFLEEIPVRYPVLHDPESRTLEAYGVIGMPTGFLVDREGTVRAVHEGFRKGDADKLRAEVLTLLDS